MDFSAGADPLDVPVTIIEPDTGWTLVRIRDLWEYRELLFFLVWRDVKVRYKQTALGAAWAILQPLLTTAVFAVFFGRMARVPSDGVPYPIFAFSGLLLWTFFTQAVTQSSNSLVTSSHLITKVYFPRVVVPIAAVIGAILDFLVASPVLVVFLAVYDVPLTPRIVLAPLFVFLAIVIAVGAGLLLAALNVEYRDVRHTVPFLIQLLLFVSPIIYPSSSIASRLVSRDLPTWLLGLNPFAGAVEGFRWCLLGTSNPPSGVILTSCVVAGGLLLVGVAYFRKVEKVFADVV